MRFIGRLRLGYSALALLVAVALAVPMLDCVLTENIVPSHAEVVSVADRTAAPVTGDSSHQLDDQGGRECWGHLAHCLPKLVAPSADRTPIVPQLLVALGLIAVGVLTISRSGRPAVCALLMSAQPAVGGRGIATRLCVARR